MEKTAATTMNWVETQKAVKDYALEVIKEGITAAGGVFIDDYSIAIESPFTVEVEGETKNIFAEIKISFKNPKPTKTTSAFDIDTAVSAYEEKRTLREQVNKLSEKKRSSKKK